MKIHMIFDCFEIWLDIATDKPAAVIYEALNHARAGWEIDAAVGVNLPPHAYISAELESVGARIRNYCEVETC